SLNINLEIVESCLRQIRESVSEPNIRIAQLTEELVRLAPTVAAPLRSCFDAYQSRQEIGMVNGLLVKNAAAIGVVLPVRAKAQPGTGRVDPGVPTDESFVSAVSRARAALNSKGWLSTSQDIMFTVENTDATYTGSSISLPS